MSKLGLDLSADRVKRTSKQKNIQPKESQPKDDEKNIFIKGKSKMRSQPW